MFREVRGDEAHTISRLRDARLRYHQPDTDGGEPAVKTPIVLLAACIAMTSVVAASDDAEAPRGPGLATGVRVGEVTHERAILWIRLTRDIDRSTGRTHADAKRSAEAGKKATAKKRAGRQPLELAAGWTVDSLDGACPGVEGEVRVLWGKMTSVDTAPKSLASGPWQAVDARHDFCARIVLSGLAADTLYAYRVETRSRDDVAGASFVGSFRTAPKADVARRVSFTVVTGQMFHDLDDPNGFDIYPAMAGLAPDFLVATGDTVYYDSEWPRVRSVELARYHWHRMYSLPRIVEFHRRVPGYWIKDDHDVYDNDCWPAKQSARAAPFTFAQGQEIFREQVPMGERTYRTVRWGQHLQVWIVEGRDFRSANNAPDGSEKTIWGREQIAWLKKTLLASDATFRVLVSATPIVGPDRGGKKDNHANAGFRHEGDGFRAWAREHLDDRFWIVCGDRHWQYHSVHPTTGVQEFSCGPASDKHAGGTPGADEEYHRFHRVKGGFLSVTVDENDTGLATIAFRFHDVAGAVVHEHRESAVAAALRAERRYDADGNYTEEAVPRERAVYDALAAKLSTHLTRRSDGVAALTIRRRCASAARRFRARSRRRSAASPSAPRCARASSGASSATTTSWRR